MAKKHGIRFHKKKCDEQTVNSEDPFRTNLARNELSEKVNDGDGERREQPFSKHFTK